MSKKIAMIGAGSVVFCKTLMSDIMATPALSDSEFALMSPTESKLRRMESFGLRMIRENGIGAKVWATTNRREAIVHAAAMDPLSSAVCTLKEIRDMCIEMLERQRRWLPQFEGKEIRPMPVIHIPPNCQAVAVPLNPALAINKRFGTLIEQRTE